jgi:uncharacterized membrane protein YsdA (DUF1294 family)/cold shock CspA family protein
MAMRARGKLVHWDDEKGFGFVAPEGDGKHFFVHIRAFPGHGFRKPMLGDTVSFEPTVDEEGRLRAVKVQWEEFRLAPGFATLALLAVGIFFAGLWLLTWIHICSPWILRGYLLLSAASFAVYARDKVNAMDDLYRVPEIKLHLLDLAGGWPGALYARHLLRHKNQKVTFRVYYWLTVCLNLAVLGYALSSVGREHQHLAATWVKSFLAHFTRP